MPTDSHSSSRTHFLDHLDELKQQLVEMGSLVEARVSAAVGGLVTHDLETLDEVAIGDAEVNVRQMRIDDRAFKLLALQQPVAVDLRSIVAAIKINGDLERVGDLAVNIAESARRFLAFATLDDLMQVPRMAEIAQAMLTDAIESFVKGNLAISHAVLERDDALDSLRAQTYRGLVDLMTRSPHTVPAALELMLIAKHLERIGDHATNIAEDVFFVVAGEDIRHHAVIARTNPGA